MKKLHEAHPAQIYRSLWEEMAVYEGDRLLTRNNRIMVPAAARKAILASIHNQHTGQTKTHVDFRKALLEYRNTPRYDGLSHAQRYTRRRQRMEAAALPSAYDRLSQEQLDEHKAIRRRRREGKHQVTSAQERPTLDVGTKVLSQNMKTR